MWGREDESWHEERITSPRKNGERRISATLGKAMGIFAGEEVLLRFEDNELHISSLRGALYALSAWSEGM
jgi:hypothetical protein